MYPDWPRSKADLVPLPLCDGPKLKAFDFKGKQQIEFLEYLGEGLHAHVFKVRIRRKIYALKLFRFLYEKTWLEHTEDTDLKDRSLMSAFYNYSEPFSCECRAFGRLQEEGYEDLAVECFGYVLLDENHERVLHDQFPDELFNGDAENPHGDDVDEAKNMRARFLGRDGRKPPIRGIVKEFCPQTEPENLDRATAEKVLGDIGRLQQLGIISLDIAARQLVGGKLCDLSKAITVPHFVTTPELNPYLTRSMCESLERETFGLAIDDYLAFDDMVYEWNEVFADEKGTIQLYAFPNGNGCPTLRSYELRDMARRQRVYTFVDPRRFNWKKTRKRRGDSRRRLRAKPPLWIYCCGGRNGWLANQMGCADVIGPTLQWNYKNGFIFPVPQQPIF
ncbi:kinetochore Sim4 complex subunit FTA2-domain-containing protein [Podospora conica]|nr:kinetochore Sim4 complex subunit FTA2-domain-containing protein [Schizothecium conicum]